MGLPKPRAEALWAARQLLEVRGFPGSRRVDFGPDGRVGHLLWAEVFDDRSLTLAVDEDHPWFGMKYGLPDYKELMRELAQALVGRGIAPKELYLRDGYHSRYVVLNWGDRDPAFPALEAATQIAAFAIAAVAPVSSRAGYRTTPASLADIFGHPRSVPGGLPAGTSGSGHGR